MTSVRRLDAMASLDADDDRAPGFEDVRQMRVLLRDGVLRVEGSTTMRVLDRLQRLDHREFLDRLEYLAAPALPAVSISVYFCRRSGQVNCVARRARLAKAATRSSPKMVLTAWTCHVWLRPRWQP